MFFLFCIGMFLIFTGSSGLGLTLIIGGLLFSDEPMSFLFCVGIFVILTGDFGLGLMLIAVSLIFSK